MNPTHLFTKTLSSTDVKSALSVPCYALEFFPIPQGDHVMQFEAVDITGFIWRFRLSTRCTGRYPKPVLLRSLWHFFVEKKGLVAGDRVMFFGEHDHENGTRYSVGTQRKIGRLFGKDLWVDV
ncbi:hypothetical protein MANES_07G019700v8 [Manihot esculenta]|uniref:TF-B3 domain-containing protein n=1 Tax=Manihot esculenta TaxID=3983 RepID=A0A2C9VJR8_MANES|nr:hypothetical protein MANES_07G019700v8 [Manihot esculenta]